MESDIAPRGLSILNASPRLIPGPSLLHELVATSNSNGFPAIEYRSGTGDRTSVSYSQLHRAATALAARMSETLRFLAPAIDHQHLVIPILMPQSPALYIGLLAILKVGAAFCPLNLNTPIERIKFIFQDVGARLVLIDPNFLSNVPRDDGLYKIISIDESSYLDTGETVQPASYRIPRASDLAYVMYTSGSTGTPKGVGISHLAATQSLLAHDRHIPSFKRFLQFAAPTFDVSVFEIFFPLFRATTLISCNRADMLTDLPGILRDMRVDACELTPSVAGSLLKRRNKVPGLRLLLTIGEMLTEPVIQEFGGDQSEGSVLWGMYGPTEATIHCTLHSAFPKACGKHSIGVPLDTVSAFVIDGDSSNFQILPLGQVGELAVGGSQIATGYINQPEQTAAVFIDTRWGRIYRTGDKARMLHDGTIECLGRISSGQVKINGQRIELGEVEHAILRTQGCHGAFATVISNILVAFAAVEEGLEPARIHTAIISQCKSWLPAFMIPTDVRVLNHFPQLPSGKVDKSTLVEQYKAINSHDIDVEEVEVHFKDDLEYQLCEIAETLLGQHIIPSTHISSLGLDSLAAIEYASMIKSVGIVVNPIDILNASTIRELHDTLRDPQRTTYTSISAKESINQDRPDRVNHLMDILRSENATQPFLDDIERVEVCSHLQQAMIAETLKDTRLYVNQTEFQFPSHIPIESIKSWFFTLAQSNEILRTGFVHLDHELVQVIWKELAEEQVTILSHARPFEEVEAESFLRRPLQLEIIPGDPLATHRKLRLIMHHSIYDGWTIDLLIEDLSLLAHGQSPVERPQFSRVSQHLGATLRTEMMDAKEFWAETLQGSLHTPFPNFRTVATTKPNIMTMLEQIDLNPTHARDFALRVSITPQVLFQACLSWIWGATNAVDDIIIGSVSSGRTIPVVGIEKIMGPCMATLPLRVVFSRHKTIAELLQNIHIFNRKTLKYGDLPLVDIKRAAGFSAAQNLYDIVFAYQETLISRRRGECTIREVYHKDAIEAKLLVEIYPHVDHFSCQITWHAEIFPQSQIEALFQHLSCLVNYFIENLEEPLDTISRCFPVQNLSFYNERPKHIKVLPSLCELVERTALRFPTYDALCFASSISTQGIEATTLTYQELNLRANRIARCLQESGAVSGGIIAIVMEKSHLLYCAILGILKAGCAYLPILPNTPKQRVELILQQSRPQLCLVDESSPQHIAETSLCSVINFSHTMLSQYSDSNLDIPRDSSNLAYIIYTSGTTGSPKGVSVTNANMLSNLEILSCIYPHETSDRMLQACSQAFDVSVFEIFFAWGNGMCLCSATNDTLFEDVEETVRALRITHLSITVTVASLMEPSRVPSVKFMVTAGEPMTDRVLDTWAEHLWQGYGPSETTNICTVRKVSRGDSSQYLGWSLENTSSFVFSPNTTALVPFGCIGELCFGGDQVAAGYLDMAELTATKFFEHPEYGRLYRSGDIGRMLPNGSLIILGRIDNQVKLRGLRIELQEIQATVLRSDITKACTSVLVTLRSDSSQQLALFFVPKTHRSSKFTILPITDSERQSIITIQELLRVALPDYMIPSFIFPISLLPLTSSGKIDHDLLHQSARGLSDTILSQCSSVQDLAGDLVEWSETETLILQAISETIRIDRKVIGRWTSFAVLGIDSISAMPLVRRLQSIFQQRIPLSFILSHPSIGRLASLIAKEMPSVHIQPGKLTPILPEELVETVKLRFSMGGDVETVLPCTPLQEAMLSSSRLSKVGSSYNNQMLFQLRIPSQIMIKHWNMMFERHGILRTCFMTTESSQYPIVQVVLRSHLPAWQTYEASSSSFQELVHEHGLSLPFAIDSCLPPVSLALVILEDCTEYISFVCHHAIYDGVSVRSMLAEIESLSRCQALPAPQPFESFLRETLPLPPETDDFWVRQFHSYSPYRFDKLTSTGDLDQDTVLRRASGRPFSSILSQLRDLGVSLLPFCQTAWAVTLSILQDDDDVCFGNVVSGRSIALEQVDTLVAPCFNTIPIRMNISRTKFVLDAIKVFQRLNAEMIPYQFTSLRRIQSRLGLSHLVDTILILQPQAVPLDENIWSLEQEHGAMDMPLVCEVIPSEEQDTVMLQLHRDPSIFSHETSLLILDIFEYVLDTCLEHPLSHTLSTSKLPARWQRQIAQISLSRELPRTRLASTTSESPTGKEDWSEIEIEVRSVLSRLTRVPERNIRRETSIYRYGLDSISAMQFASMLRRESYSVSALDVIENPTCAGIASRVTAQEPGQADVLYDFDQFEKVVRNDLNDISDTIPGFDELLPCSPTQQGMISQFLNSKGANYFNFTSWALKPSINSLRVVEAWAHLTAHHQILRTGFVPVNHPDTSYAMVVYSRANFTAPVSICSSNSFEVSKWRAEAASEALTMLSRPPWQVVIVVDDDPSQLTMHLAIHHALYDAHSLRILLHALVRVALDNEEEAALSIKPALSACFNFTHFQSASEAFWKGKVEDLVVNKFPIMTPLHITGHSILNTSRVCDESIESLRRGATEAGVTIRAALQAAWTRVLSGYIGESSVTFGIVLNGRHTNEEQDITFPMITTLPIFARNTDSNTELLNYMMKYNTSLRRHERTPLSKIQRWLGHSDSQLFDTILSYQTVSTTKDDMPGEVLDEAASLEYKVALEVVETDSDKLELNLTHDGDILPTSQAHILLQQFEAVLVDLLTTPQSYANRLACEKPNLFSILPAVSPQLPGPGALLHQLVEQTVQRIPHMVALEFVEELGDPICRRRWTYRELDEMGNRVASMLVNRNVPSGSIVATCFNKCPEAYFSILGVLKAGCAFLSLDPTAPASRLSYILEDSGASCLLIESDLKESLDINATIPIHIVREPELLTIPAIFQSLKQISPSSTCYCLYTSGTTGTPKGCLISHDNVVQAMLAFKQLFAGHWDIDSRWLQFASFHFDVSVLEQYWSWFVGITLVAAPKDLILGDITATISRLGITHIDLTPSLAKIVHPDEVPSLCRGVFITGGEQLRREILEVWGPKEVIYNAYGPTEATIGVTMFQRVPVNGRSSNIGNQFPNVGTYILEPGTENPVLRGGVGELCVSGRLVGQGYLNRNDLTEERFPTLKEYGERVYRTGDLVRVLHDGSFDFLGRADDQVKLRGQRLEIGEINHVIKTTLSTQLTDIVTFVTRHLGQDRDFIISFLAPATNLPPPTKLHICSEDESLDISRAAHEACRNQLPGYMIPTYILCVPYIPLSSNNKADVKRLKQLFMELSHDHLRNLTTGLAGASRGLGEKEQLIALAISVITQATDTDMRPASSIFELGIDSINVVRLARILQSQGFTLASPSLILRHPHINSLCQALQQTNTTILGRHAIQVKQSIRACYQRYIGMACRVLSIGKTDVEYIAPCTPLQEGMITRSNYTDTQSIYFNQFRIDLDSQISINRLRCCWDEMLAESAILRTAFIPTTGGYVQVAIKQKATRWFEVNTGGKDIDLFMSERREQWVSSNHDILRYTVEVDHLEYNGHQVLLLRLFHGVYDGHSFELLLRRLNAKYHHEKSPSSPAFIDVLPHGPLLKYHQSKPFWKTIFENHAFQPTPNLADDPAASDVSVSRVFHQSEVEARRLSLGATHQTILQAAWLVTLQQKLGFVPTFGVIYSGRSLIFDGIEDVVGPVFNTLPFRAEISSGTTWASLIRDVQNYNTSVLEFIHTPLRDIQKWCSGGQPLFDILWTFNREDAFPTIETQPFWSTIDSDGSIDYPLAVEIIMLQDKSLKVNTVARKDIATHAIVSSLLDEFGKALRSLATLDDDAPLLGMSLTTNGPALVSQATQTPKAHPSDIKDLAGSIFSRSSEAREVRHEVASLAGIPDEDVTETTSFFELGLDSIDSIKLAARLKRLGLDVTASELMKSPTIKDLLVLHGMADVKGGDNDKELSSLNSTATFLKDYILQEKGSLENMKAVLPPTPLQDSMVAEMLLSDFDRYFNHDVMEITADTDIDRLKSAWIEVHANSPILRTTFVGVDHPNSKAAFCQVIREEPLEIPQAVELSSLDDITTVIDQARHKALLGQGKSHLFQLAFITTPKSRYLVVSIAHALYDGWSLELLHRDVEAAYVGNYHVRSRYEPYLSRLLFIPAAASESFWAGYLDDVRPTILSPKMGALDDGMTTVVHRAELVSKLGAQDLKTLCQRYRVTPQVLAQGCWAPVLASMFNTLEITFGVVLSGRDTEEAQSLLFPTMNTIPLRIVLHGSVREYYNYLQATMSEIMEHQHLPLREIQKTARFKGGKLFDTLFLLQNVKEHRSESHSRILRSVQSKSAVEYPLCVEMEIAGASVMWHVAGHAQYFSLDDVAQILNNAEAVLDHIFQNHTDVLEFSQTPETVSVCGLAPFYLADTVDDGIDTSTISYDLPTQGTVSAGLESPIMDVLSELSGIEKHSINQNHSIYHLGLDSISAIKAASMLRKRGLEISVRAMLKANSIHEILAYSAGGIRQPASSTQSVTLDLDSFLERANIDSLLKNSGVEEAEIETVLPALPMQIHMLSAWQNTGGLLFFPQFTYKISGHLDRNAVLGTWSALVNETPMLRTRFAATESVEIPFIQIIMAPRLTNSTDHRLVDHGRDRWAFEEAVTPFSFVHVDNLQLGETWLHLRIHHALYDGVSLPIMVGRFLELYKSSQISISNIYRPRWYDFVSSHYLPETQQQRFRFWTLYLRDTNIIQLLDRRDIVQESQKTQRAAQLRRNAISNVSKLKIFGSANGTSLQALFFAAYSKALVAFHLSRESDQRNADVAFGVYLANRASFEDIQRAPFPTLSIVPLLVKKPLARSLIDVAIQIQEDLVKIGSFQNSSVSLWEIYTWTGIQIESCINFMFMLDAPTAYTNGGITMIEEPREPTPTPDSNDQPWNLVQPNASFLSQNVAGKAYKVR
ncbi:uncharacterized protein GGS25DRAFT_259552 [Hypoxylon fragiforme]|uniref:uncharacterized protein n=1 Tax=Hypoxylon fragiforme TaxID=63214 RepID=UPI0020C73950|nr:uncharacterized protein GGS25DRAFT_259552 [Hypoxylon fragiforme]KAI2610405.1 hypothetical protein GGS25DRAFT_259552 [Hypoxylon fragiforme]